MERHRSDRRVQLRHLLREENISQLGVSVARCRMVRRHVRLCVCQRKTVAGGPRVSCRGDVHDSHGFGRRCGGRLQHERQQELGEHGVANVVDAELRFVAVLGQRRFYHGDAGIVVEDVETRCLGFDGFGCGFGAFERGEVEFDWNDVDVGAGVCRLDF